MGFLLVVLGGWRGVLVFGGVLSLSLSNTCLVSISKKDTYELLLFTYIDIFATHNALVLAFVCGSFFAK